MRHTAQWLMGAVLALGAATACKRDEVRETRTQTPAQVGATEEQASEEERTDQEVTQAVLRQLAKDPGVDAKKIGVATAAGIVELTGTTDAALSKKRAGRLAELVRGVRSVSNRIDVQSAPRPDADLQREVETALLYNAATDSYEIDAEAKGGVVTLTGKVQSWQEKQTAQRVAEGVRGVQDVRNSLQIDYAAERTDAEILADVQSRLRWDALVDSGYIDASVKDGAVTLNGQVGSVAEQTRAFADAWVTGVRSVDASGLRVSEDIISDVREPRKALKADAEIERAIEDAAFYDPRVQSFKIQANVSDGTAILSGTVDNLQAKLAAESLARHTVGVSKVENDITVVSKKQLADQTKEDRIEATLAWSPITESFQVDVDVKGGKATLTGAVDSYFESATAADIAAATPGIEAVDNELKVRRPGVAYVYSAYLEPYGPYVESWNYLAPTATRADSDIAREIEQEMFWSPSVDADEVSVIVVDGKATLSGKVDSWWERQAATENALEGGAIAVYNQLQIE